MTSKERMLTALAGDQPDHVPCSFMIFRNLYRACANDTEFVEKQVALGLDAFAHVGYLPPALHPAAQYRQWVEEKDGETIFCRRIDTPEGPLTARVRQRDGWPREDHFPIFDDYVVTRAEETLVKPERDLDKLPYLFGPARDEDIETLRRTAAEAKRVAEKHQLLQVGGWKSDIVPGRHSDVGIMGCDAMAWLSGYEDIMILSMVQPEIVTRYAEIIHEWTMKQIEIYLDVTDADILWRRAWYETTEFWTPDTYRQIVAPFLRKEADLVHQAGKQYGYIITSAFLPILDDILASDIDVLIGLDPEQGKGTDFAIVKEKFAASGKCIWGGVSGAVTVELGTEEATRAAVRKAHETLGPAGFILSPVDNVREDTENARRNTRAFIEEWKSRRDG